MVGLAFAQLETEVDHAPPEVLSIDWPTANCGENFLKGLDSWLLLDEVDKSLDKLVNIEFLEFLD